MIQNAHYTDFDVNYAEAVSWDVIGPLAKYYFRLETVGLEQLPDPRLSSRPIIFLANHAGRCLPWDAVLLDNTLSRYWIDHFGMKIEEKPRSLAATEISEHPLLVPYRLLDWWRKLGCLDATARNFQHLLRDGKSVIIFPEGIPGIARDFRERYQLLPFSTSVVRMAARYNAQLVPISIIGSEYFHPYARRTRLTDTLAKWLNLPFLPFSPFSCLLPFGPWLFYMALPAKVTISIGAPYEVDPELMAKANWKEATEKLRQECQQQLNEARAKYEKGWQWFGLIRSLLSAPEPWWKLLPFAWPFRFVNHARRKAPHLFPKTVSPWRFLIPIAGWFSTPQATVEKEMELPAELQQAGITGS